MARYESVSIGEDHLPDAEEAGREPMAWQVFPAWGTIAKRTRERLAKTKKWHDDQDAAYVAELNTSDPASDPVSDPVKLRTLLAVGV